jgi:hypothetical protein
MGDSELDHALTALEARDWENAHRMLAPLIDSNESVPWRR